MIIDSNFQVQDASGNTTNVTPAQLASAINNSANSRGAVTNGSPTSATTIRENMTRSEISSNAVPTVAASGVLAIYSVPLFAGDYVSTITWVSGSTAGNTMTHQVAGLYGIAASGTASLLAKSADGTSAAWGTDTAKSFTLGTPQAIGTSGLYYAVQLLTGTTLPNFVGRLLAGTAISAGVISGQTRLSQSQSGSLTDVAATFSGGTPIAGAPYTVLS